MGYTTKAQLIKRKKSEQWYINLTSALPQAMDFERGERVEWFIEDRATLVLRRLSTPPLPVGKAKKGGSKGRTPASSKTAGAPSGTSVATRGRKP